MARNYSSIASEKALAGNVSNIATQITLDNVTNLPSPPYTLVLNPDTAIEEIITWHYCTDTHCWADSKAHDYWS